MTMNSERQLEPAILLSVILINPCVLYACSGNEKSVCAPVCVLTHVFVSILSPLGYIDLDF